MDRSAPWITLLHWQPFRIDALGLVTLLGAEEINASLGRLVRSTYLEFLPLLGAFVVSGDRFKERQAGFNLFNITVGIHTTDLSAWFTRWLAAQNFPKTRSIVKWSIVDPQECASRRRVRAIMSLFIGALFNGVLIALVVLTDDGWGLANALSMLVSIFVRWYIVTENEKSIDNAITAAKVPPDLDFDATALVIMADSNAVTLTVPTKIIVPVFCANIQPLNPLAYEIVRWIGWIAFAVHIISIGMADVTTQIYTVVLIILPTFLTVQKLGCDDSKWKPVIWSFFGIPMKHKKIGGADITTTCYIGSRLKAEVYEWPLPYDPEYDEKARTLKQGKKRTERRQDLYAWLQMTWEEEQSVDKWDLFPHVRDQNTTWWNDYNEKAKRIEEIAIPDVAGYKPGRTLSIDDPRNRLNPQNPDRRVCVPEAQHEQSAPHSTTLPSPQIDTGTQPLNPANPAGPASPIVFASPGRAGTWPPTSHAVEPPNSRLDINGRKKTG